MKRRVARASALALLLGAAVLAACFSERARPAPPLLSLTLAKTTVRSPDTLSGTVRATDADGLDSVWLTVDSQPLYGWNGAFMTEFDAPFRVVIGRGFAAGTHLPLRLAARDIAGFRDQMDTVVTVTASP